MTHDDAAASDEGLNDCIRMLKALSVAAVTNRGTAYNVPALAIQWLTALKAQLANVESERNRARYAYDRLNEQMEQQIARAQAPIAHRAEHAESKLKQAEQQLALEKQAHTIALGEAIAAQEALAECRKALLRLDNPTRYGHLINADDTLKLLIDAAQKEKP